jgi:AraC-like DNA-binding protein
MSVDLGLRGAAVGLSLMIAAVLLRDRGDSTASRLSAALATAAAAFAICSAPTFPRPWQWWSLSLLALNCSAPVILWLLARATFDDDFVLRRWHGALWAAIVAMQLFVAGWTARWPTVGSAVDRMPPFAYLGLALLAVAQTVATWRADLVAGRRRLRVVVVIGASAFIAAGVFQSFSPVSSASGAATASLANALGLCSLLGFSGWSLLQAAGAQQASGLLATTADVIGGARPTASDGESKPSAIDAALLRRLEHLMTIERAYRRDGLTIGSLSAELGVPEYRLRQLINEGLGHRNFNAFLNRYRIEEAKAALADPGQKDVPVLTIAMDTGFQSIGPFNRAFKAATDVTPTEFRRLAAARSVSSLPEEKGISGTGRPA